MDFHALNRLISPPDEQARAASVAKWNRVAKPIGSLGLLEEAVAQIAALTGSADVALDKRAVLVMCADNGVVSEGVSQVGPEITALIAAGIARGTSSVCRMARTARVDAIAVDVGMRAAADEAGVLDRCVARGTASIARGPALTAVQLDRAIQVGIDLAGDLKAQGYDIIAVGEMGIGNTTTAAAVTAALTDLPLEGIVGYGSGLSQKAYRRKLDVVKRALELNRPAKFDAYDALLKVGGLDIAAMTGVFIGGSAHRVPLIVDGFISAVAARCATRLCPACRAALLASHVSAEPAAAHLLDDMGLSPLINANMRLGEGTGAVCLIPLLDMALSLYNGSTFDEMGMRAYEVNPR